MRKHSNPADKLSIIASQPRDILRQENTIIQLAQECRTRQAENLQLSKEESSKYQAELNRRFSEIAAGREVGYCRQVRLLFGRHMKYAARNPIGVTYLIFVGFMTAFLQSSIFWKLGDKTTNIFNPRTREDAI